MRLIFFGTPDYVVPILEKLHKYHEIVAVVTQSPKPIGREKKITYSAVDSWAYKKGIKILSELDIKKFPSAHLGVCASFGVIIPKSVLDHFKFGILNIHPSLLPKYRGASPIQTTIANGDTTTGITIIKMDEQMDHGPIVSSFKDDVLDTDTFETLRVRLFEQASEFLINLIPNYVKGKINLKEQDHEKATFTKLVSKNDGFIKLTDDPEIIDRKLRAYSPWPGIWTNVKILSGIDIKILRLKILEFKDKPVTVQLEGKKPVSYKLLISSHSLTF